MKKKLLHIACILLMLATMSYTTVSMAAEKSGVKPGAAFNEADAQSFQANGVQNIGSQIVKVVSTVGSIVSILVLVVLGIKYMMGSAEEKAEYKKTLLPYVIGAALVFAASGIATVIFNFASGFSA